MANLRPSEDVLRAISRLEHSPEFQRFMAHLKACHEAEDTALHYATENVQITQGRAQALLEIIDTVEEARKSVHGRVSKRAIDQSNPATAF